MKIMGVWVPAFERTTLRLRLERRVDHGFAQVLLRAVGLGGGVAALDVAVLAAGHVFGRADRDVVGAADRVVVLAEAGDGNVVAGRAGGEREGGKRESAEAYRNFSSH